LHVPRAEAGCFHPVELSGTVARTVHEIRRESDETGDEVKECSGLSVYGVAAWGGKSVVWRAERARGWGR